MNRIVTKGIVLTRTDFAEADRIISFLTPDHGKVTVIAKGVRKQKSKLAGGIELFSISDLTILKGRGEIYTLMSARLAAHYGNIVKDLNHTNTAYEMIKLTDKLTQDAAEEGYFNLLKRGFEALDDLQLQPEIVSLWFKMQLLKLSGHAPNLRTDASGLKLKRGSYDFDSDEMRFLAKANGAGSYGTDHIKFLRIAVSAAGPKVLQRIKGSEKLTVAVGPILSSIINSLVHG